MSVFISHLTARQILDSRGTPTVECTCYLTNGEQATASVPSGASTGSHEAAELRDGNPLAYLGKSVYQAVDHVINQLSPAVAGEGPTIQSHLDKLLLATDTSPNLSQIGANAILAASISLAKAGALAKNVPLYQHLADCAGNDQVLSLPVPFFNILNGGLHAGMNLDFQEFIIVPNRAFLPEFSNQLEAGVIVNHALKQVLQGLKLPQTVGDEGGFAPILKSNYLAIELIKQACSQVQLDFSQSMRISFDFAANSYFKHGHFYLKDKSNPLTQTEYLTFLDQLIADYQPFSFEDPFPEDDWDLWQKFTAKQGSKVKIIGDDLLVTHPARLTRAIQEKTCNAILVKPNQIGSVSGAIDVVNLAKKHGFTTIASHRSGETTDAFIADFAVGVGTDFVKFGAPVRGERVVKYNRLLQIESELS